MEVARYSLSEKSTNIADIVDFNPPLENPFIIKNGIVSMRIVHYMNNLEEYVFNKLEISQLTISKTYPSKKEVYNIRETEIDLASDGTFVIPYNEFETGYQYEIILSKDTYAHNTELNSRYFFVNNAIYAQRIRVYDFELNSIDIDIKYNEIKTSSIGEITIHGNYLQFYKLTTKVDGYTIEYKTSEVNVELLMNGITPLKSVLDKDLIATVVDDYTIVIDDISMQNLAGPLSMTLKLKRECLCTDPSPCSCDQVTSMKKSTHPAFFYGCGKILNQVIGTITCASSSYELEALRIKSSCNVDKEYDRIYQYDLTCVSDCNNGVSSSSSKTKIRRIEIVGSVQEICDSKCISNEYETSNGSICETCDDSCEECAGPGPSNCTSCKEGYYLSLSCMIL